MQFYFLYSKRIFSLDRTFFSLNLRCRTFTQTKPLRLERTEKIVIKLLGDFARIFLDQGIITTDDLKLPKTKLWKIVAEIATSGKIFYSIDHTVDILLQAELFYSAKQYHFAKVFYSMFFEHSLNYLIRQECERREISDKVIMDITRSVDIFGKLTWLPILIGLKAFSAAHLKTIKRLADDRNGFVHYKWKLIEDYDKKLGKNIKLEAEIELQFESIKRAVKYMRFYSSTSLYKGKKAVIEAKFGKQRGK